MRELSEEEIIKNLEEFLKGPCEICKYCDGAIRNHRKAIQGLLDLYQKEKVLSENHKIAFEKQTENLHELEDLYQKEKELSLIRFKNLVKIQEEKDKIYNEGYFQGVKDERDNTEEHIKEVIQGLDKNIASVNDNLSENYKYAKKMLQELLEERN